MGLGTVGRARPLDRVCDWAMDLDVEGGRLGRVFPCLQSMPFDERRRHRFERRGDGGLSIRSYSARQGAYRENPNQSVVIELDGDADTTLALVLREPLAQQRRVRLGDLQRGSHHAIHRAVSERSLAVAPPRAAGRVRRCTASCTLRVPAGRSHVYLRARQCNGHMAWASPVFLNYR